MAGQQGKNFISFSPKHISSSSYKKKQTVHVSTKDDPRTNSLTSNFKLAKLNAEVSLIALNKSLTNYLTTLQNSSIPQTKSDPVPGPQSFQDVADILKGINGGPGQGGTAPSAATSVTASWAGTTLNISWTYDSTDPQNAYADHFMIGLTAGGVTKLINVPIASTSHAFTFEDNKSYFGLPQTVFTKIAVYIVDPFNNISAELDADPIPTYVSALTTPPSITLSPINNGYTVAYTIPSGTEASSFNYIQIEETETSSSATDFAVVYSGVGVVSSTDPTKNIVTILASDLNKRWVRAKFWDTTLTFSTDYSTVNDVTPNSPIVINTSPSTDVIVYSDTATWGGDNIVLYFDVPVTPTGKNNPTRFTVKLTPSGVALDGYFYFVPTAYPSVSSASGDGNGTIVYTTTNPHGLTAGRKVTVAGFSQAGYNVSHKTISSVTTTSPYTFTVTGAGNQTGASSGTGSIRTVYYTISKTDIYNQFRNYYSQFTGSIVSTAANGYNGLSAPTISVAARTNSTLSSYKPAASIVPVTNGYSVTFNLGTGLSATYGEVYQKYTSWSGITSPIDQYISNYVSGGSSGSNTITVNGVYDNDGNLLTSPPDGYLIYGTGIDPTKYTYITSITSNGGGSFTLTLSDNLNAQAVGTYTAQGIVYQGSGPATISTTRYQDTNVLIRLYDDFGIASLVSDASTINPINPSTVASSFTATPSFSFGTQTTTTIPLTITSASDLTRSYYLKYSAGSVNYTPIVVQASTPYTSGTTTTYTIPNLTPNTEYTVSIAAVDQFNNLTPYTSTQNVTTSSATVNTPSSLVLASIPYGIHASWAAPSAGTLSVSKYKVELYNASSTLLRTDTTVAKVYDFAGLTAGSSYTVKVYTIDTANNSSSATTSTSFTVVSYKTDGSVPASSPDVNSIIPFAGALEVKWDAVSNNDPVTYEVHISTTSSFTPSAGGATLATKTSGTFAIIKTDPATSDSLIYGTTYYVRIIATDQDGAASSAGTVLSGTPLKVSASDIAANTITASQIAADTITATQIAANAITASEIDTTALTTKTFQVGLLTGSPIYIDGSGSYNATYTGGGAVNRIYAGTGTWSAKNTPFYIDTAGYFSLKDSLTFTPGTSTASGSLVVSGEIRANSGYFNGAITVNGASPTTPMKIGTGVDGGSNNGIYLDSNNYWYDTGYFSVGNTGNLVKWNGTTLSVTGAINASSGSFTGNVGVASGGALYAGVLPVPISSASSDGTKITYNTTVPHNLSTGGVVTITGMSPSGFNLTKATITKTGNSSFTVTNSLASASATVFGSVYSSRITMTNTAISAYDATNTMTTQITTDSTGANTFSTINALIGNWSVKTNTIESNLYGSSKYTGLSSNGAYSLWAGASTSGNSLNDAAFSVNNQGAVVAKNITLIPTQQNLTGVSATASGGIMTYTTSVDHNLSIGQSVVVSGVGSGGNLVPGYNVTGTILSVPTSKTFTLAGTGSGTGTGGVVVTNVINSNGNFIVDTAGNLTATSAKITGNITATGGSFTGLVSIGTGSIYSGTLSGNTISGAGFILNSGGLQFNSSSTTGIVSIDAQSGLFTARSAKLGVSGSEWFINPSTNSGSIYATSGTGTIYLDSQNTRVYVANALGGSTNYTAGIALPSTASSPVIWAGTAGIANTGSEFLVDASGNVTIKRGNLDIGSGGVGVKLTGITTTKDSVTIGVSSVAGISVGMYLSAAGVPSDATVATVGTSSITMSKASTATGSATGYFAGAGAHIFSDGYLIATSAKIFGDINATSGTFSGNIISTATIYGGKLAGGAIEVGDSGNGPYFLLDSAGSPNVVKIMGKTYTSSTAPSGSTSISAPTIAFTSGGKLTISNVDYVGDLTSSQVPSDNAGSSGFVRMIASNPLSGSSGNLERGPAIYYQSGGTGPVNAGFVGDIWIQY